MEGGTEGKEGGAEGRGGVVERKEENGLPVVTQEHSVWVEHRNCRHRKEREREGHVRSVHGNEGIGEQE